ncbi:hypothetical protein ACQKWADRAFT_61203 [Trichoderma austrokoningii]
MKIRERSRDSEQVVGRVGGRWGLFIYGAGAAPQSVGPELCAAAGRAAGPPVPLELRWIQWPDPRRHRHPHLLTVQCCTYSAWPLFGRDAGGTPGLRGRLLAQVQVQAQRARGPSSPRPGSDPAYLGSLTAQSARQRPPTTTFPLLSQSVYSCLGTYGNTPSAFILWCQHSSQANFVVVFDQRHGVKEEKPSTFGVEKKKISQLQLSKCSPSSLSDHLKM